MSLLSAYRRGVILLDWTLTHMYIRKFEVAGRENVPLEGPLILASNHLNNADPPMIALAQSIRRARNRLYSEELLGSRHRSQ